MVIAWMLFGALIGVVASQARGFSLAAGIIGGLLLGPLAVLMFFVSGISPGEAQRRKCPHCAEWVNAEAKICKHCRSPLGPAVSMRAADGSDDRKRTRPIARPPVRKP